MKFENANWLVLTLKIGLIYKCNFYAQNRVVVDFIEQYG